MFEKIKKFFGKTEVDKPMPKEGLEEMTKKWRAEHRVANLNLKFIEDNYVTIRRYVRPGDLITTPWDRFISWFNDSDMECCNIIVDGASYCIIKKNIIFFSITESFTELKTTSGELVETLK